MRCDLVTQQSIEEWHKFSTLGGWNDRRRYNIDLTCGLSQKTIGALNSYGLFVVDKDILITIVLFITILQNKQKQYHALSQQIQEIQDEYIL